MGTKTSSWLINNHYVHQRGSLTQRNGSVCAEEGRGLWYSQFSVRIWDYQSLKHFLEQNIWCGKGWGRGGGYLCLCCGGSWLVMCGTPPPQKILRSTPSPGPNPVAVEKWVIVNAQVPVVVCACMCMSSLTTNSYNKRQLSRIYPRGTRVGSENYMPQVRERFHCYRKCRNKKNYCWCS